MDVIFAPQIGRNMEVYVDDMIVKSMRQESHDVDMRESFENIRKYKIKLNPAKCTFGVTSGKFLGFMITQRGIEADPSQIKEIQELKSPSTLKEVQTLTGCIAALRRFIQQASK